MNHRTDINQPNQGDRLLTAPQLSRILQVDNKTIHNWVATNAIKHFRTPGRHLRFRIADVKEFMRTVGWPIPDQLK